MCYRRNSFYTYQDKQPNPIYFADETTHTPQGKGLVNFSLPRFGKILLSNVWYVPNFQMSLFPLVLVRWGGHHIIMQNDFVKIDSVKNNFRVIKNGYEYGKLLRIQGTIIPQKKNVVETKKVIPFLLTIMEF